MPKIEHCEMQTADGLTLGMTIAGEGQAIVFLHGQGGRRSNWRDQITHFSPRFRTIAPEVRGYGQQLLSGSFRYEDCARDLFDLLTSLNILAAHIVGLSMGGRIAQEFYHRYPEKVISLTLCSTEARFGRGLSAKRREAMIAERKRPLMDGISMTEFGKLSAMQLCSSYAVAGAEAEVALSTAHVASETLLKVIDALLSFDRLCELPNIIVPTLVISGADDRVTPPEASEALAAVIPHAQFVIIPRAGHVCNLEQPKRFNRLLDAFLSSESMP